MERNKYELPSKTRYRDDLVGKRVLCISATSELAVPSPTLISSLWYARLSSRPGKQVATIAKGLSWCAVHHHHQNLQRKIIELIDDQQKESYRSSDDNQMNLQTKRLRGLSTTPGEKNSLKNPSRQSHSVLTNAQLADITASVEDKEFLVDDVLNDTASSNKDSLSTSDCELCNPSDKSDVSRSEELSSLPWRLGTIRAVSDRDLSDRSLSLMIEFDLSGWRNREWYNVHDRQFRNRDGFEEESKQSPIKDMPKILTSPEETEDAGKEAALPDIRIAPGDFSVLLVESSICFTTRQSSPIGKNKLWPALIFEPWIDDLSLFSTPMTNLSAIEYFEPDLTTQDHHKFTKPTCDIKAIMAELEAGFFDQIDHKLSCEHTSVANQSEKQMIDSHFVTKESWCNCWSPRVEFVQASSIHKFPSRATANCNSRALVNGPSSKQSMPSDNLNSFKKFLKFSQHLHRHLEASPETDSFICDPKSCVSKSNDLLEAITKYPRLFFMLKDWHTYQDAQSLFNDVCTAALLVGNRIRVYRTSGTTQWYTAVITEECNNLLTLVDDTVLEEHREDPTLLEMHLIDDGLVQSIIEGDVAAKNSYSRRQRSNQRQAAQTAQVAIMNSSSSVGTGHSSSGRRQNTSSSVIPLTVSPSSHTSVISSNSSNGKLTTGIGKRVNAREDANEIVSDTSGLSCVGTSNKMKGKRIATEPGCSQINESGLKNPFATDCSELWSGRRTYAQADVSELSSQRSYQTDARRINRDGEFFAPPFAATPSVKFGLSRASKINGKNFLSHRMRLEALEKRAPSDGHPEASPAGSICVGNRNDLPARFEFIKDLTSSSSSSSSSSYAKSMPQVELCHASLVGEPSKESTKHQGEASGATLKRAKRQARSGEESGELLADEEAAATAAAAAAGDKEPQKEQSGWNEREGGGIIARRLRELELELELGQEDQHSAECSEPEEAFWRLRSTTSETGDAQPSGIEEDAEVKADWRRRSGSARSQRKSASGSGSDGRPANASASSNADHDDFDRGPERRRQQGNENEEGRRPLLDTIQVGGGGEAIGGASAVACAGVAEAATTTTTSTTTKVDSIRAASTTVAVEAAVGQSEQQQQELALELELEPEPKLELELEQLRQQARTEASVGSGSRLTSSCIRGSCSIAGSSGGASGSSSSGGGNSNNLRQQKQQQQQKQPALRRVEFCSFVQEKQSKKQHKHQQRSSSSKDAGDGDEDEDDEGGGGGSGSGSGRRSRVGDKQLGREFVVCINERDYEDDAEAEDDKEQKDKVENRIASEQLLAIGKISNADHCQPKKPSPPPSSSSSARNSSTSERRVEKFSSTSCIDRQIGEERAVGVAGCGESIDSSGGDGNDKFTRTTPCDIVCQSSSPLTEIEATPTPAGKATATATTSREKERVQAASNEDGDDDDDDNTRREQTIATTILSDNSSNNNNNTKNNNRNNNATKPDSSSIASSHAPLAPPFTTKPKSKAESENEIDSTGAAIAKTSTVIISSDSNFDDKFAKPLQPTQQQDRSASLHHHHHQQPQQQAAIFIDSSSIKKASSSAPGLNVFPASDTSSVPWTSLSGHQPQQQQQQHCLITQTRQASAASGPRSALDDNYTSNQQEHQQTTTTTTLLLDHYDPPPPPPPLPPSSAATSNTAKQITSTAIIASAFQIEGQTPKLATPSAAHQMAMHNIGPNLQEQKKNEVPWQNQQQQQQSISGNIASGNSQSAPAQQYGSAGFSPRAPIALQSTLASKVDQIIRTTLYDSIHMPNIGNNFNTSNTNHHSNMPSPTSSQASAPPPQAMIFNQPANLPISSSSSLTSSAQNLNASAAHQSNNARLMSSPLASYYGSTQVSNVDTLNNISGSNLSTKIPSAHSVSQSALVAAATLQSLNQSHQQRSQSKLARLTQTNNNISGSSRPPSNSIANQSPQGINSNNNANNMPKLGVTSTTSSDHQNHNHLALPSIQQQQQQQQQQQLQIENAELVARFQLQQKPLAGIRQPVSWPPQPPPDQANNSNGNPRWLYTGPYSGVGNPAMPGFPSSSASGINNLSNSSSSNNMIGPDGDINQANNISMRQKNDLRQPFGGAGNPAYPPSSLDSRNNYQWLVPNIASTDGPRVPNPRFAEELEKDSERLTLFTYNLLNSYIPGTNRLKKVIPLDSSNDELRQSIYCQEFYTRFEDIAVGILTNQVIVPDFSIIDYICRDKFTSIEMDRMETVHKRLGLFEILYKIELAQRSYNPNSKADDMNKPSDPAGNLNFGTGIYQPILKHQLQTMNQAQYSHHLPGKSDNTDKGNRSSQSPSDILSRSQLPSNGPLAPRLLDAHSLAHRNYPGASLAMNNSHLPPPPVMAQRAHQSTPQARSSPFLPHAQAPFSNTIRPPPPTKTNTPHFGGLGPPHELPMNIGPNSMLRQPPAAHQSSSARPSILGSVPSIAHAQSSAGALSGPPVTAHMSSKTPQTPRLYQAQDGFPSAVRANLDNHSPNRMASDGGKGCCAPPVGNQLGYSPAKSDLDNMNTLPVHVLLSYKQQELLNRSDNALKRVGTPHYPNNGNGNIGNSPNHHMGLYPHGLDVTQSPGNMDTRLNSRSPMNNPRLQSIYSPNAPPPSDQMFKTPTGNNLGNSMPPPHPDYQKHLSQAPHEPRLAMLSPNSRETHLDQYKALMNAYQQQSMMNNKSSMSLPMDLNGPNKPQQQQLHSPHQSANEAIFLDLQQNSASLHDARLHALPQQAAPTKQNQRSIISGPTSVPKKSNKKVKLSPTSSQISDNKSSISPTDANKPAISPSNPSNKPNSNVDINSGILCPQVTIKTEDTSAGGVVVSNVNNENDPLQIGQDKRTLESLLLSNAATGTCPATVALPEQHQLQSDCASRDASNNSSYQEQSQNGNTTAQGNLLATTTAHGTVPLRTETKRTVEKEESPLTCVTNELFVGPNGSVSSDICLEKNKLSTSQQKSVEADKDTSATNVADSQIDGNLSESLKQPAETNNNINNINNDNSANKSTSSLPSAEPSKYQKLYTKKAWLKNYDQEDQEARSKVETEEMVIKKSVVPAVEITENALSPAAKDSKQSSTIKKANNTLKLECKKKVKAKKKGKDTVPSKKTDSSPSERARRVNKTVYNDSEASNASTSDLDSDDTSNSKMAKQKKLRRMPRRKVKPSSDKEDKPSPKAKVPVKELTNKKAKKTKVADEFLQIKPCYDPSLNMPRSIRCLECRKHRPQKNDKVAAKQSTRSEWDNFCRFYEFRKLRYNESAQVIVAGFSTMDDANESDKRLWTCTLHPEQEYPKYLTYDTAKYILANVGDEFCNLVEQERAALDSYIQLVGKDKKITWKRNVNDTRELCDVCSTTLFNCHYVCERCGFVVCIDCYKTRASKSSHELAEESDGKTIKKEQDSSILDDSSSLALVKTNENNENIQVKKSKKDSDGWIFCAKNEEHSHAKLILTQIIAGDCLENVWSTLQTVRDQPDLKMTDMSRLFKNSSDEDEDESQDEKLSQQVSDAIEGCLSSLADDVDGDSIKMKQRECKSDSLPDIIGKDSDSFESETHSWLCDRDLLVLTHPQHSANLRLFRRQWRQGKPVLVRGVDKLMKIDMWLPQFFSNKFGEYRSDLVDCRNGDIHQRSMKKYWDGFEPVNPTNPRKKFKDDNAQIQVPSTNNEELSIGPSYYIGSALWRLKDWPPGQDFKDILPKHYEDFMNNLPLKKYTTRTGKLNLSCRLPEEMLKPDLGPKMYSAYGTAKFPERGTTNLHLDISDAINVMVYVSGASSFNNGSEEQRDNFDKIIDECCVDDEMKNQIRSRKFVPGALWHVFKPSDTQKMREFLNEVADERKISKDKRTDPIHDQTWYLDQTLLDRLEKEHGVKSYAILQCMGDAILIPAGAPHQVKNLQNCIKVANDFVSPENVRSCLQLTDEFRSLPETHINQEDKLQIKNILYHSVKESLQYLSRQPRN